MKRFINSLSTIRNRAIVEAVRRSYSALFEAGLSPQKKTRRALRNMLPEPPGGWDSPAKRTDGSDLVSQNGNVLTWDQALETYLRGLIFRDRAVAPKFEPGVARIAYGELGIWPDDVEDYRSSAPSSQPLGQFRSILHMISGDAHVNEYDFDLNGMGYDEMVQRFGKRSSEAEADDTEDTGVLNYKVVHIPDFDTAEEYAKYTNHWCVCEYKNYFNRYMARGKNTFYMLFAPGFEKLSKEDHGEGYPRDEYAMSVIGPVIAPDGSLEYCCLRRNHEGGMGDHELTEKDLSRLLGRPMRTVLPYIENEETGSLTASIKKKLARGMTPEEIYGTNSTQVWDNAVMYRTTNYNYILVNTQTMLPIIDDEIDRWEALDGRAIYASITTGTDEYDSDVQVDFLIRKDGQMFALGTGDMDACDEYDPMYYNAISSVGTNGIEGLYLVRLDNGETYDMVLVYLPETAGPYGVTDVHEEITVYAADGLVVCDPDSDTLSSGEGDLEIFRMYPDGTRKELLGSESLATAPNHVILCGDGLPDGKVNILYDGSDSELRIIHDGEDRGTGIYAYDFETIDSRLYPGLVWAEKYDDSGYCVYSIKDLKLVADNLPDKPDDFGIFEDSEGKKNMVTSRGLLLEHPALAISVTGSFRTPIKRSLMYTDDSGRWHNSYFVDVTMPDGEHFINIDTGKELYGKAIPHDAYPYTEHLYIGDVTEGNKTRQALFTLDGERTSCAFDKLNGVCEVIERCGNAGIANGYNIINPDTGKELFPFWLVKRPEFLSGSMVADGIDRGLLMCTREDEKQTIVMMLTPVKADEEGHSTEKTGNSRFELTDIGWHDHFEQIPGCPFAMLIHDSSTGERPLDAKKYLTVAYDFRTGKHTGRYPGRRMMATIRAFCQDNGFDLDSRGIAKAIAACPDWTEWIDVHIDTAPRWGED